MVCDKVVCERWCVTKLCVKDGLWQSCVWKMVCDKVVCERWCVTKLYVKDGVWQSCVWKMVCNKVVCERWCAWQVVCERWCVTKLCVKDGGWQCCGWKMVCDKVVWKTVSDKDGGWKMYVTKRLRQVTPATQNASGSNQVPILPRRTAVTKSQFCHAERKTCLQGAHHLRKR